MKKPSKIRQRTGWAIIITTIVPITLYIVLTMTNSIDPIPLSSWPAAQRYFTERIDARLTLLRKWVLPSPLVFPAVPQADSPTLADFWEGRAEFVVDVADTGLPMGESDTIQLRNGALFSYVHASERSAGVVDQCGDPVAFPGCVVIYHSTDGGEHFHLDANPVCQIPCNQCPCNSQFDHIDQQQYPRTAFDGERLHIVYEYQAMVMHRTSEDGEEWSAPTFMTGSGVWEEGYQPCPVLGAIGPHPHGNTIYDCLVGGPPGIHVENDMVYLFVAMGQNPGTLGCYTFPVTGTIADVEPCVHNPLIPGATVYGPVDERGPTTNAYFDFRTISSAELQGIENRYYLLYEGVRGPGPGDPGDTQFGLGLARSQTDQIDGPWEIFPENPILVDLPGNIGLGHADLVVLEGETYLYTSLDGVKRSRLALVWQ